MEGGPPTFRQDFTCPALLKILQSSTRTGLSPTTVQLSRWFRFNHVRYWPGPRSLATTKGVSVDVLSSGYLDVSVRRVRLAILCIQIAIPKLGGFPHSEICGSKVTGTSPQLIAACHVLHRLYAPRHSPNALLTLESSSISREQNSKIVQAPSRTKSLNMKEFYSAFQ